MYNARRPNPDELPTTEQLIRSTKRAALGALVILVTIVLPAEYGIDATGVGRLLGLKEMGEIKQLLAEEAQQEDTIVAAPPEEVSIPTVELSASVLETPPPIMNITDNEVVNEKKDSMSVTLPQNGSTEIKVTMQEGDTIEYTWVTEGGSLNYNVHGEPFGGGSAYEYDKGLNETEKSGTITAEFNGTHGWYWRNRSDQDVTLTIDVSGEFNGLKKM